MSKATILIVEDEAIVAADLAGKLGQLGYAVCGTTARGEEAIAHMRGHRPDLVLMDIRLAGAMDGVAAAEHIRREFDVPVIYLTAHSDRATVQRAKLTEPFGYILKPFEELDLQTHIEMGLYKHGAERKLRESEQRFATTLASIGDAVISTDTEGRVAFMNPVAERLTGWTLQEALHTPAAEVFHIVNEHTRHEVESPVTKVLREGGIVGLANHTLLLRRDGTEVPIDDSGAPIKNQNGSITGVVLVFRDITERRQADNLYAFLAQTGSGTKDEPFFSALAPYLAHSLGMDFVCIDRLDGDGLTARTLAVWCNGHFEDNVTYALKDTPCGEAVGKAVCCFPASVCQFFPRDQVLKGLRAESYVGVTLWSHIGQPIGLIAVIGRQPLASRQLAESMLKLVAVRAGAELERLDAEAALQRANDELEQRVRERTAALSEANRTLTSTIVERSETMDALRESESRLSEAQRIGHVGGVDWDLLTDRVICSDELFRIFGHEPQSFVPSYAIFLAHLHADDHDRVSRTVNEAIGDVGAPSFDFRILRPDGQERHLRASAEVQRNGQGLAARIIATVIDVTDQVRAQEEADLHEQQLIQSEKMVSLGILTSGVAHEINNPNHLIMGNVASLREVWQNALPILDGFYREFGDFVLGGYDYAECRDKLDTMYANALAGSQRIQTIVDELRTYSRSSPTDGMTHVDVNGVVVASNILLSSIVKKSTDHFSVDLAADLPTVFGNAQRLEQVVINLVQNACHALAHRDKAITVRTRHDAETQSVIIEVCDEGAGIEDQDLDRLSNPFFTTRRTAGGTGLGLWVSFHIVHQHGGTLQFFSRKGEGTRAVVTLPKHTKTDLVKAVKDSAEA